MTWFVGRESWFGVDRGPNHVDGTTHDPRSTIHGTIVCACVAAAVVFAAYSRTLLRGVDLGDTGGFQAAVASPEISARQAYPLYYALARPFVALTAPDRPALGLNLFSATVAAAAVGVLTGVSGLVANSASAGLVAGLLFGFSYTWWHQAIIAEVYSLHLLLVGVCLALLHAYATRPSRARLAIFFAAYALSFGNHLMMVLLLLPFALFLISVTRPRDLFSAPVIALAIAAAAAGAAQYMPQFLAARHDPSGTRPLIDAFAAFWFDVTKADWRESMAFAVPRQQFADRAAMIWFDARQQFGVAGLALAVIGAWRMWRARRRWARLALTAYGVNLAFAATYNVGDPHVFLLPGHYFTALLAGCAFLGPNGGAKRTHPTSHPSWGPALAGSWATAASLVALLYAGWRGYDTLPAADRHEDRRADRLVASLTFGVDERDAVMVTELDWQVENALIYATRVDQKDVAWTRLADVLLHFPLLVADNRTAGRDIVLTAAASQRVTASFGPLFPVAPDGAAAYGSILTAAERLPEGTTYVFTMLASPRSEPYDPELAQAVMDTLTGDKVVLADTPPVYSVYAGVAGQTPVLAKTSTRPFRDTVTLAGSEIEIRMDGWLPAETFRRGGFGHVIRKRQHVLALERGLSLIWWNADGTPSEPIYAGGLYAQTPRFRIPAAGLPELARR